MAIEKLETRISYARKKWVILKSIIGNNDINDIEYIALERCVEILSQTIIDVSIWIIRYSKLEQPNTNRQIIQQMKFIQDFEPEFIQNLSLVGGLRNILVHEYTIINQEFIIEAGKELARDFPIFIDIILKFVKEQDRSE